jgi:hypothetical protein
MFVCFSWQVSLPLAGPGSERTHFAGEKPWPIIHTIASRIPSPRTIWRYCARSLCRRADWQRSEWKNVELHTVALMNAPAESHYERCRLDRDLIDPNGPEHTQGTSRCARSLAPQPTSFYLRWSAPVAVLIEKEVTVELVPSVLLLYRTPTGAVTPLWQLSLAFSWRDLGRPMMLVSSGAPDSYQ